MDNRRLVKISKYLSKHLRHRPERPGLKLSPGGWVRVDELLGACRKNNFPISRQELDEVVAKNDKQRFSLDDSNTMIRANQGHSMDVDLDLEPQDPPLLLYHGTAKPNLDSILKRGLQKMGRHHVHLSRDVDTAFKVGKRHGKPVILEIEAGRMAHEGFTFFVSDNDVWLVEVVPPRFLKQVE